VSDDVLASDAEREAVTALLRRHLEDGRLTTDEFGDRLDTVYAARTRADLDAALAQLPVPRVRPRATADRTLRIALQVFTPAIVCTLVWAFSHVRGEFWPKWVFLAGVIAFVTRLRRPAR
jgi:hypothetical protein